MPSQTLIFDEENNRFESFWSCHPEFWVTLGINMCSFEGGILWTHDNDAEYNKFFGVNYPSSITAVFNENPAIKKKYLSLGYESKGNKEWVPSAIETSTINSQTGLRQQSRIIAGDMVLEETVLTSGFLRDVNSMNDHIEALQEGDFLGGNYISIKFEIPAGNATELVSLVQPYVISEISQRNF